MAEWIPGYRNTTITVGATAIQVSPAQQRKSIYIKNISTTAQVITVYFSDTQVAVASGGGYILSVNENVTDSISEGYIAWAGEITAISSAAGGTITVAERL